MSWGGIIQARDNQIIENRKLINKLNEEELIVRLTNYGKKEGTRSLWELFNHVSDIVLEDFTLKTINYSKSLKICKCIHELADKTNLNHQERIVLLNILMPIGEEGERELLRVMSKQENYKENSTKYQMDYWRKNTNCKPISRAKLKEWKICHCK